MSFSQNLGYSVIQIVHNLGAVATVGASLGGVLLHEHPARKRLAYLALGGWLTQAASGAAFGAVSYLYYHHFPDISGIARYALGLKMLCATLGILLLLSYLWRYGRWQGAAERKAWFLSALLAVTAISAAAFLRWFA